MTPLRTQRIEKAVLETLEVYEGVPLSAADVAAECDLPVVSVSNVLKQFHKRYVVQARTILSCTGKPIRGCWLGMPKL